MALELYKPDEATKTRGFIALLLALLIGYGVFSLHEFLDFDFWRRDLFAAYGDYTVQAGDTLDSIGRRFNASESHIMSANPQLTSETLVAGTKLSIPGDDPQGGLLGPEFPLSPRVLICLGLTVACAFGVYTLSNHPRVVDFLIETEKELQNVSWSPRHEVISNSIIVVITVIIVALYLGSIDYLLALARNEIPWQKMWDSLLGTGGS